MMHAPSPVPTYQMSGQDTTGTWANKRHVVAGYQVE